MENENTMVYRGFNIKYDCEYGWTVAGVNKVFKRLEEVEEIVDKWYETKLNE